MSYGAQIKLGIARQTAGGTSVTAVGSFFPLAVVNETLGLEKEELISENLSGRFEQGAVYDGVAAVRGTIEFEVTPSNLVPLLMAAVNYQPINVTSGALRSMTWIPNTQDFSALLVKAPITAYKQFSDSTSADLYYDCQFSQLDLVFGQGQFMRARATVVGGTRAANGVGSMSIVPVAATLEELFPWNVTSAMLGSNPLRDSTEITISLNENIEALYSMNGTLDPYKYSRSGFREVTVNGTAYLTSREMMDMYAAGTMTSLTLTSVNTRTAIQSGYYHSLTVEVPRLKFTSIQQSAAGPGEVAMQFTGRGVVSTTSGYSIRLVTVTTWAGTSF